MSAISYINPILAIFVSLWVSDWHANKLLYKKDKITIEKNLIFLLSSIMAIILEIRCNFIVKQIVNTFMYFLPILMYKIKIKDKIYYGIINWIMYLLVDQFINYTMSSILNIFNLELILNINISESLIYYTIITYLMMIVLAIIINIKKYINFINIIKLYLNDNYKLILNILVSCIIMYLLLIFDLFYEINSNLRLIIFIVEIFILIITIENAIYNGKQKYNKKYIENLVYNMEGNKKNIDTFKIEKHNINNFLISLKDENNLQLNKRIDNYLEINNKVKITTNNIFDIPYNMSGFITNKINQYNCKFYINGAEYLKDIKMDNPRLYNEVCNAIGITIDNAYDAIKNQKTKEILIEIAKKNDKTVILISNIFENTIDISELGNLFYTTKDTGNGIGLFSINKSKYIKYKISIINNMFNIKLTI